MGPGPKTRTLRFIVIETGQGNIPPPPRSQISCLVRVCVTQSQWHTLYIRTQKVTQFSDGLSISTAPPLESSKIDQDQQYTSHAVRVVRGQTNMLAQMFRAKYCV